MGKLNTPQPPPPPQEPLIACEICGKENPMGKCFSYITTMAITGHDLITAFNCPAQQHYGCSPEHALEAAIECLQEHLHPTLITKHIEKNEQGKGVKKL